MVELLENEGTVSDSEGVLILMNAFRLSFHLVIESKKLHSKEVVLVVVPVQLVSIRKGKVGNYNPVLHSVNYCSYFEVLDL